MAITTCRMPSSEQMRECRRVWTSTGLKVTYAVLDKVYQLKRQATERFLKASAIQFDNLLPDWNYTVVPTAC